MGAEGPSARVASVPAPQGPRRRAAQVRGGRRPPARAASVPAPQGPRKVGARSAPGFLVIDISILYHFPCVVNTASWSY